MTDSTDRRKRLYSGNSTEGRSEIVGLESENMRDVIKFLEQELVRSKAETQNVNDQLNSLIALVKR